MRFVITPLTARQSVGELIIFVQMNQTPRIFDKLTCSLIALALLVWLMMIKVGPPSGILDARVFYTHDQAYSFMTSLDDYDRGRYKLNELLDLFFLSIYTLLLVTNLRKVLPQGKAWFGFIPGAFDLLETLLILRWLQTPNPGTYFGWWGFVTLLKWTSGAFLVGILIHRYHRLKQQNDQASIATPTSSI